MGDFQPAGDVILDLGPSATGLPAFSHGSIVIFRDDPGRTLAEVDGRELARESGRCGMNSSGDIDTMRALMRFPIAVPD